MSGPADRDSLRGMAGAMSAQPSAFWTQVDELVASSRVVIDRPRHSEHPRYPGHFYPVDYGYLDGTTSGDGEGIDVWIGAAADRSVTAAVCTVDLRKRDMEVKLLLGCSPAEIGLVTQFLTGLGMGHQLLLRSS